MTLFLNIILVFEGSITSFLYVKSHRPFKVVNWKNFKSFFIQYYIRENIIKLIINFKKLKIIFSFIIWQNTWFISKLLKELISQYIYIEMADIKLFFGMTERVKPKEFYFDGLVMERILSYIPKPKNNTFKVGYPPCKQWQAVKIATIAGIL